MASLKVLFDEAMYKQRSDMGKSLPCCQKPVNRSGFKWVLKVKHKAYKKGHGWRYQRVANDKRVSISATDLFRLYMKVVARGYEWIMLDEETARKTIEDEGYSWEDFVKHMESNGGYDDYSKSIFEEDLE